VVIAPGVAVTNAHNANIVDGDVFLGRSAQHDLLFFRTDHGAPLATGRPQPGEAVVAYGEGQNGELRVSRGVIRNVTAPVKPLCTGCLVQHAFTFESNAGPGFSGGPVLNADGSQIVGITFGYADEADGTRLIYAYDMALVEEEWRRVRAGTTAPR
jgi:S1-C subfamily serine protease